MSTAPSVHHLDPITLGSLPARLFSDDGLVVDDLPGLLAQAGCRPLATLRPHLPALRQGGVQTAPLGVIQDPAGSAVGSGSSPSGGGASGAIYQAFPDLLPIPAMQPGDAVFNASPGPGRRVLHSFSPQLRGKPGVAADREARLGELATAFLNALAAMAERAPHLGDDGGLLNLVPLSASIFAGAFRDPDLRHLDPSYTLAATLLAVDVALTRGISLVPMTLSYFDPEVLEAARECADSLG